VIYRKMTQFHASAEDRTGNHISRAKWSKMTKIN
jgi:hypothetical protein